MSDQTPEAINAATRFCAVFGHPIAHSASPEMQNAGLSALGLNWRYLAFDVPPEQLRAAIEGARVMGFAGLNLTVPHKLLALEMVDVLDAEAKRWGAVNTIVFENGAGGARALGYNTDADAIVRALRESFSLASLEGISVLLLGAGGAARTAALRLAQEKVGRLHLVNRTTGKAEELARDVQAAFPGVTVTVGYPERGAQLVINGTSLGLKREDALPMNEGWLERNRPQFVYDMIYRPNETALLRRAKQLGCAAANGAGMLLYQGARSLELWTGRPAPLEAMRAALKRNLERYV